MPISQNHQCIFIHIPKNAGTSIMKALEMEKFGHNKWDYYQKNFPGKFKMYYKFAVIRNPWERLVSNYEYAKMDKSYWHDVNGKSISGKHRDYDLCKNKSFTEVVKLLRTKPKMFGHQGWEQQYSYIYDSNLKIKVDNIIRIEDINEEFEALYGIKLEHVNTSPIVKDYKKYYDPMTKHHASVAYNIDMSILNYKF